MTTFTPAVKPTRLTWAYVILREDAPKPGQDLVPVPPYVRAGAKRALTLRPKRWGNMTHQSEVARAEQLRAAQSIPRKSIENMHAFFSANTLRRKGKGWNSKSTPSEDRVCWDLCGGDEGRAWVENVLMSRYRPNPEIIDEQYAPAVVAPELAEAGDRAIKAGATEPLTYIGAGMTGIVFLDSKGLGYKVYRWLSDSTRSMAVDEFEWLVAAQPVLESRVVRVMGFDENNLVLIREFIKGRPGRWGSNLYDHHRALEQAMLPHGWGAPEFKEDSYVFPEDSPKTPVLVDASMARRVGDVLLAYVDEIITGVRPWLIERPEDLGFALRAEASNGTISREDANVRLLALSQELVS